MSCYIAERSLTYTQASLAQSRRGLRSQLTESRCLNTSVLIAYILAIGLDMPIFDIFLVLYKNIFVGTH